MADLAIVGGALLTPGADEPEPGTLLVSGGRIEAILPPGDAAVAGRTIDAEGLLVFPGAIDVHFHCRAPSYPERGDFASESRAAAAGGVTTLFEMPIADPCASTTAIWNDRREVVERDAYINIGLYGAPGRLDRDEVQGMAAEGAIAFKLFMTRAVPGREQEFLGLSTNNAADIVQALELVRETGLRCVFHAEDQSLIDLYSDRQSRAEGPDYRKHLRSRPAVVEASAVAQVIALAEALDTPIHIAHVSSAAALEAVRQGKARGAPVSAETCPHYLLFTEEVLERVGPYGKINPPIREAHDRDALWRGLEEGVLDLVCTDHAPFAPHEKEAAWGDILGAPPGHPGVEQLLPLMVTEALNGRFSLGRALDLISARPAELFSLPTKGALRAGADADIVLYDSRPSVTIDRTEGFSKATECNRLYDGMTQQGRVVTTLVGGRTVFDHGEIVAEAGVGGIVRPQRG
jgi:dihydroorotase (multifunctional complex type)